MRSHPTALPFKRRTQGLYPLDPSTPRVRLWSSSRPFTNFSNCHLDSHLAAFVAAAADVLRSLTRGECDVEKSSFYHWLMSSPVVSALRRSVPLTCSQSCSTPRVDALLVWNICRWLHQSCIHPFVIVSIRISTYWMSWLYCCYIALRLKRFLSQT